MKALKILVISMALLIVVGLGFVGYGVMRKTPHPAATPGTVEMAASPAAPFGFQYPTPKGFKLEQVLAAGDRVVLRYSAPDGDRLVFIDSHSGQIAGTILLPPETK